MPSEYAKTELEKLPCREPSKFVLAYDLEKSLYLFGKTGTGKTRTVYLLCRRLIEEEGLDIRFLRGTNFQSEVVERLKPDGIGGFEEWMEEVLDVDALVIDEVDKIIFSPRCENEFFNLIESRTSNDMLCIFTANNSVDSLLMAGERRKPGEMERLAEPTIRRIQEFFLPVRFAK